MIVEVTPPGGIRGKMNINLDFNITISKTMAIIIILSGLFYGFFYEDPAAMEILIGTGAGILFHKNYVQLKEKLNGGKK